MEEKMNKVLLYIVCNVFFFTSHMYTAEQKVQGCLSEPAKVNSLIWKMCFFKDHIDLFTDHCKYLISRGFYTKDVHFVYVQDPCRGGSKLAIIKNDWDHNFFRPRHQERTTYALAYLMGLEKNFAYSVFWDGDIYGKYVRGTLQQYKNDHEALSPSCNEEVEIFVGVPFVKIIDAILAEMVFYHEDAHRQNFCINHHDQEIVHFDNEHCLTSESIEERLNGLLGVISSEPRPQYDEANFLKSCLLRHPMALKDLSPEYIGYIQQKIAHIKDTLTAITSSDELLSMLDVDEQLLFNLNDRVRRMLNAVTQLQRAGSFSLIDFVFEAFPDVKLFKYLQITKEICAKIEDIKTKFPDNMDMLLTIVHENLGDEGSSSPSVWDNLNDIDLFKEQYQLPIYQFILANKDRRVLNFSSALVLYLMGAIVSK